MSEEIDLLSHFFTVPYCVAHRNVYLETVTQQPLDVAAVHSVTEPPPASAEFPIFIFIIFGGAKQGLPGLRGAKRALAGLIGV